MPVYQKLFHAVIATIFRVLLVSVITFLAFSTLYTNDSYILSVLDRNSVYDRLVPAFIQSNREQPLTGPGSVTLGDEQIQTIINKAIPAEKVRNSLVQVVSNTYDWLEYESESLTFSIDLSENKKQLTDGLTDYTYQRLLSLPTCQSFDSTGIDPLTADCVPLGFDVDAQRDTLEQEFNRKSLFIDETTIDEETILGNETLASISDFPKYYHLIINGWPILLMILILVGTLVVLTAKNRIYGLRKVGKSLLFTPISLAVFTFFFSFIVPVFTDSLPLFSVSGDGLDAVLNDVSLSFGRDYARVLILYSLIVAFLGAVILAVYKNKKPNKYAQTAKKSGLVSGYRASKIQNQKKRSKPPIQSSDTIPKKSKAKKQYKKYKKIMKKEL
jgi:hypothetical protein